MSLVNLCMLLLCIQPLIIYSGMFSYKEKENKSDLEFQLSFLVIAPSFVYFYLDTFWYALLLLSCVGISGGVLAKAFESRARRSLPSKDLCGFMIAWLIIFSIGYGVVSFWGFIEGFFEKAVIVNTSVKETSVVGVSGVSLLISMLPSLIYMALMISVFLIKLYEIRSSSSKDLSANALLVLCVVAGVLPLFSDYYIVSLIFNCLILVKFGSWILTYKETDPSAGAIGFLYSYVFVVTVSISVIYKGIMWLLRY